LSDFTGFDSGTGKAAAIAGFANPIPNSVAINKPAHRRIVARAFVLIYLPK
jgi:hypothetical protein